MPAAEMLSAAAVFAAAVPLLRLQLFWLLSAGAAFGVSSEYQRFHYLATYTGVAMQRLGMVLPSCPGGRERGEDALCRSAERPVRNILELTGLGPQEEVLEIG
jgi:hypothetical protein